MDESLRELERRTAADPSDGEARLALSVALVRSGKVDEAAAAIEPASARGYRLLLERASSEPALLALLDRAPEWRSSGGDPGCTRWSRAEAVSSPATLWRRRIEEVHGALAVACDRGRAFVATFGPRGTELIALSVLSGETLWRFPLGKGPPAAPLAKEGRVYGAALDGPLLRSLAFEGATGKEFWHAEDACDAACLPGALNVTPREIVLPVATTWRGSSRVPDGVKRAFLVAREPASGRMTWQSPTEQVFSEVEVDRGVPFAVVDFVTGEGAYALYDEGRRAPLEAVQGAPQFLASRHGSWALAIGGTLSVRPGGPEWSSIGGAITSLALDEKRVLIGRGAEFSVRDAATGATLASWSTHESPLPYRPRGAAHAPPAPRSAVCAGDLAYLASPLSPSIAAWDVKTGAAAWRHEIEGLLVPEDGPRFTWPTAEVGPPDRGPLHLAPLPGAIFGITLSGYAFLVA